MREDIDTMPVITLTGIGQGEMACAAADQRRHARRRLRLIEAGRKRAPRDVFQRCGNFRIWAVVSTSPKVSSISERAA